MWYVLQGHCFSVLFLFNKTDQGPRKYYVHNDIFRYQDEVFSEETSDEPADGNVGEFITSSIFADTVAHRTVYFSWQLCKDTCFD